MSGGLNSYIAQRQAEAEAARIIAEAIEAARAVLTAAGVDDQDDILSQIWESDCP